MGARRHALALWLFVALSGGLSEAKGAGEPLFANRPAHFATNVAQFRTLSAADFLTGCDFQLSGVVTLVDTNRNIIVLQDSTGAVALNAPVASDIAAGDFAAISGSNCSLVFWPFPNFPHRPAFQEIRTQFEAPGNGGDYYLVRMRGWLHPPATGSYRFWIASDNSSDLWLSTGAEAGGAKKIATVPRYCWVAPREWSRFPSQQSEAIWLEAGNSYYIEALQEQMQGEANLAVAWQGPGINQSVITAAHLKPYAKQPGAMVDSAANGILLESWTNYTAGSVGELREPRPFQSALSLEKLEVTGRRAAHTPKPRPISFDQKWLGANNYCWVEVEGVVAFAGEDGEQALLTLADGKSQLQARAVRGTPFSRLGPHAAVRVEGVCEGIYDENGALVPGVIWITTDSGVAPMGAAEAPFSVSPPNHSLKNQVNQPPALEAFYGARGVVTFNDRVFDTDCLFIQEGDAAVFVKISGFKNQLKVGDWIDLGGALESGRFFPTLKPMTLASLGVHAMPVPLAEPIEFPLSRNRDGKWTEIEGAGFSVKTNGILSLKISKDTVNVWIGGTGAEAMRRYVDAQIRVRGVLSATALEMPMLLVPSRKFVEMIKPAPDDPFATPLRSIAYAKEIVAEPSSLHRVRVAGGVSLQYGGSFFIQDASGGIRVQPLADSTVKTGDAVEVVAFPMSDLTPPFLAEGLVRVGSGNLPTPSMLDLSEALPVRQNGSLVSIRATLLAKRTIGISQILDLQEGERVFTATLMINRGIFPTLATGSRLEVTGVCIDGAAPIGITPREKASLASINLWLRSPADVKVSSGPPWWTWRRAGALIGTLLTILSGALVWVHFLRRRLERQKKGQLAASQQVLKRLEEERRRIAANLHDGLGQALLLIKNQSLVALKRTANETAIRDHLREISGATSQALEDVRQITHGLRPCQLDRLGLTQALRATVTGASADSAIVFASRVEDIDSAFDKDSEIHLYRVVQEGISNIIKHSAATEATVVVKKRNSHVSLSIRDNGRGFDVAGMSASLNDIGYGLSGIAERVRILGGQLTIDSRPGAGANLNVYIPIWNHAQSNNHNSDRG